MDHLLVLLLLLWSSGLQAEGKHTPAESVRLVGGDSYCAGTLEVKMGDWRPVSGPLFTLKIAAIACEELNCGSAVSVVQREEFPDRSTWTIRSDCVYSGSDFSKCVRPSFSSSRLDLNCSDPTLFIVRVVVLPLTLLLMNTALYFCCKASRGQSVGRQENTELYYYNLGV